MKRYMYVLGLILVLFTFSCCAVKEKEKKLERISIAFQEWVGYGPLYLAQEKGFCQGEGIELNFIDEQLDSARRDAFKVGMLDMEAGTLDLLVSKRAQDTPLVAVLVLDYSFGGDGIVALEGIKSLEDLRARRVTFARDDVGETLIAYLFFQKGLSLNDIIIIPKGVEEAAQAFLDGEADAVVTWEPFISLALKKRGAHILATSRDYPGIIVDTLNVREDIVKNNPQLVKKLMRAWFKALKFYQDYPEDAVQVIAKHYNLSPQEYIKQVEGLKWSDYAFQAQPQENEKLASTFDTISEIKFTNQRIAKKPEAKDSIDKKLLRELYEDSK